MASGATICKAALNVADMDRGYYADHALTIARHPSETDERMMVRIVAFGLHAHERLEFGKGIGAPDEPDLVQFDLNGRMEHWIDVGQPDERRIRKACGQAERVSVCAFGGRTIEPWWAKLAPELARFRNLSVLALAGDTTRELASLAGRNMELQLMVQEGEVWLSSGDTRLTIEHTWLVRADEMPR